MHGLCHQELDEYKCKVTKMDIWDDALQNIIQNCQIWHEWFPQIHLDQTDI